MPEGYAAVDDPILLRGQVIRARSAFHRGDVSITDVYVTVDRYLDACEAKAKRLWPKRKYHRPSRAYILRAL